MEIGKLLTSRRRWVAAAAGVCAISLSACGGGPQHSAADRYFLVATNKSLQYWQTARAGFAAAARPYRVHAELVGPDTYDPQLQVEEFRAALARNPAGILVSAADPRLMAPEIDRAISRGVPVVTIDSDVPQSRRLFFIGTDNYEVGVMGGERVARELNGKGNLVVYTMPEQANLADRLRGYREVFARFPQIKLEVVDVKGDARMVFDTTQTIVEKRLNQVDGFVCLVSLAAPEVVNVLERKRISGKFVMGMDTNDTTLEGIEKGLVAATIAQKPYTMAYHGMRMLADMHLFPPASLKPEAAQSPFAELPAMVYTGATLIDKSNIAEYRAAHDRATQGR